MEIKHGNGNWDNNDNQNYTFAIEELPTSLILQEETEIGENETTGELWDRLKEQGAELLLKTIKEIEKGTAPRTPQGDNFTIAPMLKKEMAKIDFMQTAEEIKNKVRGLNPIMGAYSMYNSKKVKFWKVEILDDKIDENIEPRNSNFSR